jgi:hypothetical protein
MNQLKVFSIPHKLIYVGYFFSVLGFVLAFFRFYLGYKPEFLESDVFAFYSIYIETKFFEFIKNNFFDEIIGIVILIGQYLIILVYFNDSLLSKKDILLKSFFYSLTANTIFLIISLIFVFGLAFVYILILNMISFNTAFIILYNYFDLKAKKRLINVGYN